MASRKAAPPRPSGFWRAWRAEAHPTKKDRLLGQFLTAHEGFARLVVERMRRDGAARGCDTEDLMQAARIGLLLAAQTWDPARARFTTWAWWKIRHEVRSAITKDLPLPGRPGRAGPQRVNLRKGIPGPEIPVDRDSDDARGELAEALVRDLSDREKAVLFRDGGTPEERAALVAELRGFFGEEDAP